MATTADSVVIEIEARTGQATGAIVAYGATFERTMTNTERAAARAELSIDRSSRQLANSQRNLGRQIADVGTQLASGASPFLIIAQQAPQFADALADGQGRAARFAAFFAGPWGAAILAGVSVLGILIPKLFESANAHDAVTKAADAQKEAEQALQAVVQGTIDLSERARIAALEEANARVVLARETLNEAKAKLALAQANAAARFRESVGGRSANYGGVGASANADRNVRDQQNLLEQAQIAVNAAEIRQRNLEYIANTARGIEARKEAEKADRESAAASRRAAAEARRRQREAEARAREQLQAEEQLIRGRLELAEAEAALTADSRLQDTVLRQRIEAEQKIAKLRIQTDPDLSAAQKAVRIDLEDKIAAARLSKVNVDEAQRYLDEELALRSSGLANERDILSAQEELVETSGERRAIQMRLLDLAYEMERAELEAVVESKKSTETQKQIARERLALLEQLRGLEAAGVERANESPAQRFQREIYGDINDQLQSLELQGLRELEDTLTDSAKAALGLKGALGDVVGELIRIGIQRQIIGPIANALFGPATGGVGILASIFGRAGGGRVAPGQMVRVNEHRGGVELFQPDGGGKVIPLGQANSPAGMPGAVTVNQFFTLDARQGITTPQLLKGVNALVDAKSAQARDQAIAISRGAIPREIGKAQRFTG